MTTKTILVVDTNVILRFLLGDHPQHFARACKFMVELQSGEQRAHILESVLAECVFVLFKFYRVPRSEITEKLLGILALKGIECESYEVYRNALLRFESTNLSIVDTLVWSISEKHNWSIFSFDSTLNKKIDAE